LRVTTTADQQLAIRAEPAQLRTTALVGDSGNTDQVRAEPTLGGGAFLNYTLQPTAAAFELGSSGRLGFGSIDLQLLRAPGHWSFSHDRATLQRQNPATHQAWTWGESTLRGGELGSQRAFAGVQWGSDFSTDPSLVTFSRPIVRGFLNAPATIELFVDDVLRAHESIAPGPFEISDVPFAAPGAKIRVIAIDATGSYDVPVRVDFGNALLLRSGLTDFSTAGGLAQSDGALSGSYRGAVLSGSVRHGSSQRFTEELHAEDVVGAAFANVGLVYQPGASNLISLRAGAGGERRALSVAFDGARPQSRYGDSLSFDRERSMHLQNAFYTGLMRPGFALSLGLTTSVQSGVPSRSTLTVSGSRQQPTATTSLNASWSGRRLSLGLSYNPLARRTNAVSYRIDGNAGLAPSVNLRHGSGNPVLGTSYAGTLDQHGLARFDSSEKTVAGSAEVHIVRVGERETVTASVAGGIGLLAGHFYALPSVEQTFGVACAAGYPGVRVTLDGRSVGRTDARGCVLLPRLVPYTANRIGLDGEDLPLGTTFDAYVDVVPFGRSPQRVVLSITGGGGFTVHVMHADGSPLLSGAALQISHDPTRSWPVGYGGLAYLTGIVAGPIDFLASEGSKSCRVHVDVPRDLTQVPDLGTIVCQPL
jgi:outer membrane usher protein